MKTLDFSLSTINMEDITSILTSVELNILLWTEPNTTDVDIMLENMLDYFIEIEEYLYAAVIRDEIKRRQ